MHRKIRLLSPGKGSSHSTALSSFFPFSPVCSVFVCFHTTSCEVYSFTANGFGIFNVRVHWLLAVHTKGDQAQTNLHKSWLRETEKLSHQGIEPRVFGLEFWRSNHWATSPVFGLYTPVITKGIFSRCYDFCDIGTHNKKVHKMHFNVIFEAGPHLKR